MHLTATTETFPLARAFTIARGSKTEARVVTVTATDGTLMGRGECVPYARYGETAEGVLAAVATLPDGVSRRRLPSVLPPGAARNAVDCALWDLKAKQRQCRVWDLAGLAAPSPLTTAFTLSLDSPSAMQTAAAREASRPVLKIKLGTPDDLPRLEAVRRGAPAARIIVDANEGWTPATYLDLVPHLIRLGVVLVEQPFPAGGDAALADLPRPVPVCADESCHDRASLAGLVGRYDLVNIKLDKTGGLTEALAMKAEAQAMGFGIMVGCMVGTSLGMAPALLAAQGAAFTDLDGPLLLAQDRDHPLRYDGSLVYPPDAALWG